MAGKPKPTALKRLLGTARADRMNANEPKPTGIPTCPSHLNSVAKREWTRISKELLACGLLTSIDRAALACYCVAWSRIVEAEKKIAATGLVVQSPTGYPIVNPYVGIANRATDIMHKFAGEFGLTPSSRSRLSVNPDSVKKNDWDEMFGDDSEKANGTHVSDAYVLPPAENVH
jgi:P27 family predicted phage terminase small subunit